MASNQQKKELTAETQGIVNELRVLKDAMDVVFGQGHTGRSTGRPTSSYTIGRAISRLSQLDVQLTRERERP